MSTGREYMRPNVEMLPNTVDSQCPKSNAGTQRDAGRFFHQMLPVGETRFALVGGSHMENGSQLEVEVFEVVDGSSE